MVTSSWTTLRTQSRSPRPLRKVAQRRALLRSVPPRRAAAHLQHGQQTMRKTAPRHYQQLLREIYLRLAQRLEHLPINKQQQVIICPNPPASLCIWHSWFLYTFLVENI